MSLFPELSQAVLFFVDAAPVAQPRQRHAFRNGIAMSYIQKSHPIHVYKQVVKVRAKAAYQGQPFAGPLRLHVLFLLPRPDRLVWKTKPMPRVWAPGRPDVDNFVKAVMDALNGTLWADYIQVVELHSMKMYAAGDESPGAEIMCEELF